MEKSSRLPLTLFAVKEMADSLLTLYAMGKTLWWSVSTAYLRSRKVKVPLYIFAMEETPRRLVNPISNVRTSRYSGCFGRGVILPDKSVYSGRAMKVAVFVICSKKNREGSMHY
jgi:hypothetical protein